MTAHAQLTAAHAAMIAAQQRYNDLQTEQRAAVNAAVAALNAKDFTLARAHLDRIGMTMGEPAESYSPFWVALGHDRYDPLDLDLWHWLQANVPLRSAIVVNHLFAAMVSKGSRAILEALTPLYSDAGDAWHYNWDASDALLIWSALEGKEAELLERLRAFVFLLDQGCLRLGNSLSCLVAYGEHLAPDLLSPAAVAALEDAYIRTLDAFIKVSQPGTFDPANTRHHAASTDLPRARTYFLEQKQLWLAAQQKAA